ncbi:MAG: hypothetical protein IPH72_07865 [Sandaracinaceae bacterium]|nr:hypothetical protein [Sandaracinaceae bacterium]
MVSWTEPKGCDDGGILNGDGRSSGCRVEIGTGVCHRRAVRRVGTAT